MNQKQELVKNLEALKAQLNKLAKLKVGEAEAELGKYIEILKQRGK